MSNLQNRIASARAKTQAGNMTEFKNIECIYLGAKTTPYFPKLEDGTKSKTQAGWTLIFSELGTSKIVKYVYKTDKDAPRLVDGQIYLVSGLGYDLRSSMLIYIEKPTAFDLVKD